MKRYSHHHQCYDYNNCGTKRQCQIDIRRVHRKRKRSECATLPLRGQKRKLRLFIDNRTFKRHNTLGVHISLLQRNEMFFCDTLLDMDHIYRPLTNSTVLEIYG